MEEKIVVGNVCFVFDQMRKKVLLLERANEPMKHFYTGVGGKTKFGEFVYESCLREVLEETSLKISKTKLHGIIKTILNGHCSAWLLFIYTAVSEAENFIACDEGALCWVDVEDVYSYPLIGFIKEILPYVFNTDFFEGVISHDKQGNVLSKTIRLASDM